MPSPEPAGVLPAGPVRWVDGPPPWWPTAPAGDRVIVDNDFAGDPDDLLHLAHQLLSPSAEVRGVISSHLRPGDAFDPGPHSAEHGAERVRALAAVLGVDLGDRLVVGSETGLVDETTPAPSAGVDLIVAEAMRDDVDTPLYLLCGGGLTEAASAWLTEPAIADRLTVVWIGGPEDPGLAEPPPGDPTPEYNLGIDPVSARVVVSGSRLRLWQVPRDAYRHVMVTSAQLRRRVAAAGPLGAYLAGEIGRVQELVAGFLGGYRETYVLGDQPLVLVSALQTVFEPDAASCVWVRRPAPRYGPDGAFVPDPDGRSIRVLHRVDTALLLDDLFTKLGEHADWVSSRG